MTENGKSCWNCGFQQIGGPTFLGICTYFSTVGKPNKNIPPDMVDVGCKQWKVRPSKAETASLDSE